MTTQWNGTCDLKLYKRPKSNNRDVVKTIHQAKCTAPLKLMRVFNDKKDIDSVIKAKNVYVGIMPFSSLLKQKWIVKISPKQAAINIDRDFFKRDKPYEKDRSTKKSELKYDLNFNLNKYSILNLKKSGLETKVKGNVIYKSSNREIIANIKSNFDRKGFLNLNLIQN